MATACTAIIWHGPGHQSRTNCQRKGRHRVHFAVYGRDEQEAYWKGAKVFSGYFNEPPKGSDALRAKEENRG